MTPKNTATLRRAGPSISLTTSPLRFQDAAGKCGRGGIPGRRGSSPGRQKWRPRRRGLFRENPEAARDYLTRYCVGLQEEVPRMFIQLREKLIVTYTNNHEVEAPSPYLALSSARVC